MSQQEGSFGQREVEMLVQIAGQVAMAVDNAMAFRRIAELRDRLKQEKQYLEDEINIEHQFDDIVGESTGLRSVLQQIATVAPTDATVLIQGETGTGKELLARAIHRLSQRSEHTFIKLNCAAIPAAPLRAKSAAWSWLMRARFFSMKWASCRSTCSPSCCAPCRREKSSAWEERGPSP